MSSEQTPFDLQQLGHSIGLLRAERSLTWTAISRHVGVATSTIRRFEVATDAEADGVLALIGWLGLAPEAFISDSKLGGELLQPSNGGVIRVDMGRLANLPEWTFGARPGGRTTIQRFALAAQAAEVSIASLTRWSAG